MKKYTLRQLVRLIQQQGFAIKGNGDGTIRLFPTNELGIRQL